MAPLLSEPIDFVQMLQEHNEAASTLYVKVSGERNFDVLVPYKGNRAVHYSFQKDSNDDFIKFQNGAVSILKKENKQGTMNPVKLFETMQPRSNKEFAINVRPAETNYKAQWIPQHNRVGTTFAKSQHVYADDQEITDWTADHSFRKVKSIKIEQNLLGVHPDVPKQPFADIESHVIINEKGVAVYSKITWLENVTVSGYGMMFPVYNDFADRLITSHGNVYDTTITNGSTTDLKENDKAFSYAYMNTSDHTDGKSDTMAAMSIDNIETTFRYNELGRRQSGSIVWLQHRNESMQKLYPQVYQNHTVAPGDTYEASGRYFVGEMPKDHPLLERVRLASKSTPITLK